MPSCESKIYYKSFLKFYLLFDYFPDLNKFKFRWEAFNYFEFYELSNRVLTFLKTLPVQNLTHKIRFISKSVLIRPTKPRVSNEAQKKLGCNLNKQRVFDPTLSLNLKKNEIS